MAEKEIINIETKKTKKIIVEVGTNGMPFFFIGNKKLKEDELYTSVDREIEEVKRAQKMMERSEDRLHDSVAMHADARNLPFLDGTVDEMVFTNVFGDGGLHAPKYFQQLLREAVRVLKIGGSITVTETYSPGFVPEFMQVVRGADGKPSMINDAYFDTLGLKISRLSLETADIHQYHRLTAQNDFTHQYDPDFQLVLVKV